MQKFEQYWLFATFCFLVITWLLRLLLRERITLQSSLWLFLILFGLVVFSVFPELTTKLAQAMGFVLPSNFFFALAVSALLLSHVHTLVTLSRTELRSITLTQEIALLREELDRMRSSEPRPADSGPRDADLVSRSCGLSE
ncbi:MAG TPA: DUF2304 domain-containing protein [Polyangiaceae bacterium]|nr:DUF2304 domain-containing protein [Polyangiaceae bacterium]